MTSETIRRITVERLDGWAARLVQEHATPMLLMGIGHDHTSGQVVICCVEDSSDEIIRGALRKALHDLGG